MAGIQTGTNFAGNFGKPLDDRFVFKTISAMVAHPSTQLYTSLVCYNEETGKRYEYNKNNEVDPVLGKWRESATIEAVESRVSSLETKVTNLDGKVIHEANDTNKLMPDASSLVEGQVYMYVGSSSLVYDTGHIYLCLEDETDVYSWHDITPFYTKADSDAKYQEIIQFSSLPAASATLENKVYQYTGATTSTRKTGTFYQCQEVSTDTYDWVQLQADAESIQVNTLPTADSTLVGKVYQYIGASIIGGPQHCYFYECIEDPNTSGTYIWQQKNVQPASGSGSASLERDITTNIAVGGIASGTTLLEGTSFTEVMERMLRVHVDQTVSLTLDKNLIQKKGTTVSSIAMSAAITKGDDAITNAKYYVGSTLVNTKDATTDPSIVDGGTFSYTYETSFDTNTVFKVDVLAGSKTVSASKTVQFINPYYYGSSATSTIADFTGLTENLVVKNTKKEVTYGTTSNQYLVFAYDKTYGALKSIIDQNGFDNTDNWSASELTVDGEVYRVYITLLPVTISGTFKYTFNL